VLPMPDSDRPSPEPPGQRLPFEPRRHWPHDSWGSVRRRTHPMQDLGRHVPFGLPDSRPAGRPEFLWYPLAVGSFGCLSRWNRRRPWTLTANGG
jgi:hypothetical protein